MANSLRANARSVVTLPVFLAPAFAETRIITSTISKPRSFSSSNAHSNQKRTSGPNRQRGVSALRSTGPRTQMSLPKNLVLPQPASDAAARRAEFDQDNNDHGLWQFFNANKSSLMPPIEEGNHGRAWASRELRKKDYTDLWKLYWVCVKEANQIVTRMNERARVYAGYGEVEADERLKAVKTTQFKIRKVLLERHDEHNNVQNLLAVKQLRELFPTAEAELDLESDNEVRGPNVQINEVSETSEAPENRLHDHMAGPNQEIIDTTTDRPDALRKQKLTE